MRKRKLCLVMTMGALLALQTAMAQDLEIKKTGTGITSLLENEESAQNYLSLLERGNRIETVNNLKDSTVVVYSNVQLSDFRNNREIDLDDPVIAAKLIDANIIPGGIEPENFPTNGEADNLLGNEIIVKNSTEKMIGSQNVEFLGTYFSAEDGESLNYVYLVTTPHDKG